VTAHICSGCGGTGGGMELEIERWSNGERVESWWHPMCRAQNASDWAEAFADNNP
jgi:hypothetical protein